MNIEDLNKIEDAPLDGTEILAYHACKSFHQIKFKSSAWTMRWNKEYRQHNCDYLGWIPMPEID